MREREREIQSRKRYFIHMFVQFEERIFRKDGGICGGVRFRGGGRGVEERVGEN